MKEALDDLLPPRSGGAGGRRSSGRTSVGNLRSAVAGVAAPALHARGGHESPRQRQGAWPGRTVVVTPSPRGSGGSVGSAGSGYGSTLWPPADGGRAGGRHSGRSVTSAAPVASPPGTSDCGVADCGVAGGGLWHSKAGGASESRALALAAPHAAGAAEELHKAPVAAWPRDAPAAAFAVAAEALAPSASSSASEMAAGTARLAEPARSGSGALQGPPAPGPPVRPPPGPSRSCRSLEGMVPHLPIPELRPLHPFSAGEAEEDAAAQGLDASSAPRISVLLASTRAAPGAVGQPPSGHAPSCTPGCRSSRGRLTGAPFLLGPGRRGSSRRGSACSSISAGSRRSSIFSVASFTHFTSRVRDIAVGRGSQQSEHSALERDSRWDAGGARPVEPLGGARLRQPPPTAVGSASPTSPSSASSPRSQSATTRSGAGDPKAARLERGVTQGIAELLRRPADEEALDPWDPQNRRNAVLLTPQQVAPLLRRRGHLLKHLEWPFLDPNSTARRCWDATYHCCMAVQLVYLPFQIAFLSAADLEDPLLSSGSIVLAVVDFFFLADMLLNFTTGFYTSMQVLQTDSRAILKHYAAGWFPVDFVATVPAIAYRVVLYSGGPELLYLNATMPLRLLRLGKIQEDVRRLEAHLKSPLFTSVMWLAKLFLLPILISHCSACLLWLVGRRNLERDPSVSSWIVDGLPEVGDGVLLGEISVFERYVCAMYFSVTVMSTVGLGDIAARLASERVLLMLIMIITSIVVGVVVNGVAQFIAKLGERSAETNERLTSASKFMKWYGVPTDLQARVHVYLKQFFDNKDREDMKGQLIDWIKKSKLLRAELNLALTGNCLASHRLLAELPRDLLVDVCELCDMVFHPPGEVLESPGSDVQRCLYIRAGCVQLSERASSLPQAAQLPLPLPRDPREQRDADRRGGRVRRGRVLPLELPRGGGPNVTSRASGRRTLTCCRRTSGATAARWAAAAS
ncbi:unnamed protein product [Prorocentrum cordatum]|uniref:Ion transport domain-containing protein n=1 Tax=Prorocentrum cordatum TaxID=2364126 RepID=A0ABN9TV32_9DINO|nr:unnamed protein product [Polarella glacialis]